MKDYDWPFVQGVKTGVMCDPESSDVDFVQLAKVEKINFSGAAVVEQDMYSAPEGVPLKIAKRIL